MSVSIRGAVQVSSLTRRHVNDALSELHPRSGLQVLKGHQNPARHIGSKSYVHVSSFSRHFQGALLRGGYPGLKPWAELSCPFGAQTLYPYPYLDGHPALPEKAGAPSLSARPGSSFSILFPSRLPLRSSSSNNGLGTPPPGYKKIHPFPSNEPFPQDKLRPQPQSVSEGSPAFGLEA